MFDDQIPSNLPTGKEPEDIFEKIEPASSMPAAPVERKPMPQPDAEVSIKEPIISSRKVIVALGVIIGILAVVGIVYGVMRFARSTASLPEQAQVFEPVAEEQTNEPSASPFDIPSLPQAESGLLDESGAIVGESSNPVEQVVADSDGDGLNDDQEKLGGSDPQNPDSDNDGLFDGEEVETYGTNPLNSDTDGDGFIDGDEVRNGYDPKGPGRLFILPKE